MSNSKSTKLGTILRVIVWLLATGAVVAALLLAYCGVRGLLIEETPRFTAQDANLSAGDTVVALGNVDHGDTIEQVMEAIRDVRYEVCAAFDSEGHKLYEYTDRDALQVEIPLELAEYAIEGGEEIFLHNHPNGAAFSKQDIRSLIIRNVPEAIVVTSSKTFRLVAENGWPDLEDAMMYLDNLTENFGLAQSQGLIRVTVMEQDNVRYITTAKLVEAFADRFGVTFTVEPRPKSQRSQIGGYSVASGYDGATGTETVD